MNKKHHGDRLIDPEPLEELVARHELEIEVSAERGDPEEWQQAGPIVSEPAVSGPFVYRESPDIDIDAGVRMQSAAIAGGSFGAAGCFDDDLLLRRANAIFTYIKNGLS